VRTYLFGVARQDAGLDRSPESVVLRTEWNWWPEP